MNRHHSGFAFPQKNNLLMLKLCSRTELLHCSQLTSLLGFQGFPPLFSSSEAFLISQTSVTFKRSHTQTHILGQTLDKFVLFNTQRFLRAICILSLAHHSLGNRNKSSVSHLTPGNSSCKAVYWSFSSPEELTALDNLHTLGNGKLPEEMKSRLENNGTRYKNLVNLHHLEFQVPWCRFVSEH